MEVQRLTNDRFALTVSDRQAWIIHSVMADICTEVACHEYEFPARLGASKSEVRGICDQLRQQLTDLGSEQ